MRQYFIVFQIYNFPISFKNIPFIVGALADTGSASYSFAYHNLTNKSFKYAGGWSNEINSGHYSSQASVIILGI